MKNHKAIHEAGGPHTQGWHRVMETSEVRHALKQHGRGSAKWKAGSRLSRADFAKIDAIVSAAKPELQRRKGGDRLVYTHRIGGWTYTYSETVSRKRQALIFMTMWRKR